MPSAHRSRRKLLVPLAALAVVLVAGGAALATLTAGGDDLGGAAVVGASNASSPSSAPGQVQSPGSSPAESDPAESDPAEEVPQDVISALGGELDAFTEVLPAGVEKPTLGILIPELEGSTVLSVEDGIVTVRSTVSDVDGPVTVVVQPGDVAVLAALDWHCAWLREYVNAEDAGDASRVATARQSLEHFPELDAVRGREDFQGLYEATDLPLFEGDRTPAEDRLRNDCRSL